MFKIVLAWCILMVLMTFVIISYAQSPIIVLDSSGIVKEIIVVPPPPPQWR
jgi:hypothetical protein